MKGDPIHLGFSAEQIVYDFMIHFILVVRKVCNFAINKYGTTGVKDCLCISKNNIKIVLWC